MWAPFCVSDPEFKRPDHSCHFFTSTSASPSGFWHTQDVTFHCVSRPVIQCGVLSFQLSAQFHVGSAGGLVRRQSDSAQELLCVSSITTLRGDPYPPLKPLSRDLPQPVYPNLLKVYLDALQGIFIDIPDFHISISDCTSSTFEYKIAGRDRSGWTPWMGLVSFLVQQLGHLSVAIFSRKKILHVQFMLWTVLSQPL